MQGSSREKKEEAAGSRRNANARRDAASHHPSPDSPTAGGAESSRRSSGRPSLTQRRIGQLDMTARPHFPLSGPQAQAAHSHFSFRGTSRPNRSALGLSTPCNYTDRQAQAISDPQLAATRSTNYMHFPYCRPTHVRRGHKRATVSSRCHVHTLLYTYHGIAILHVASIASVNEASASIHRSVWPHIPVIALMIIQHDASSIICTFSPSPGLSFSAARLRRRAAMSDIQARARLRRRLVSSLDIQSSTRDNSVNIQRAWDCVMSVIGRVGESRRRLIQCVKYISRCMAYR